MIDSTSRAQEEVRLSLLVHCYYPRHLGRRLDPAPAVFALAGNEIHPSPKLTEGPPRAPPFAICPRSCPFFCRSYAICQLARRPRALLRSDSRCVRVSPNDSKYSGRQLTAAPRKIWTGRMRHGQTVRGIESAPSGDSARGLKNRTGFTSMTGGFAALHTANSTRVMGRRRSMMTIASDLSGSDRVSSQQRYFTETPQSPSEPLVCGVCGAGRYA